MAVFLVSLSILSTSKSFSSIPMAPSCLESKGTLKGFLRVFSSFVADGSFLLSEIFSIFLVAWAVMTFFYPM
jgi:hypothetical protein